MNSFGNIFALFSIGQHTGSTFTGMDYNGPNYRTRLCGPCIAVKAGFCYQMAENNTTL